MSVLFENRASLEALTFIFHSPLPNDGVDMAVPGGKPNSVFGLSFGHSGGRPVNI